MKVDSGKMTTVKDRYRWSRGVDVRASDVGALRAENNLSGSYL